MLRLRFVLTARSAVSTVGVVGVAEGCVMKSIQRAHLWWSPAAIKLLCWRHGCGGWRWPKSQPSPLFRRRAASARPAGPMPVSWCSTTPCPDAAPMPETDAPGRRCGVPSLMVVPAATTASAQDGPPLRLSDDCAGHDRAPNALSPHRRRAATAARRQPPPKANAAGHRHCGPAGVYFRRIRQTDHSLTALFSA